MITVMKFVLFNALIFQFTQKCDKAYSIVPNSSSCLGYALVHCTIIRYNMVLGTIQYIGGSRISLQFFLGFVPTKPYWMHEFCHNLCRTRVGRICFKWNHNCYNNHDNYLFYMELFEKILPKLGIESLSDCFTIFSLFSLSELWQ